MVQRTSNNQDLSYYSEMLFAGFFFFFNTAMIFHCDTEPKGYGKKLCFKNLLQLDVLV